MHDRIINYFIGLYFPTFAARYQHCQNEQVNNSFFHICKCISLTAVLLCTLYCKIDYAQSKDDTAYYSLRQKYISDKTEMINLSVFIRNPDNAVQYNSSYLLQLNPNDPNQLGIRIQHKWLGIELAFSPKSTQLKNRGSTDYFGLHLFSYGRKLAFNGYYLNYEGYHLTNYKTFDTLNIIGRFPVYPMMNTTNWGGSLTYIFNHKKFSLRSVYFLNEIQKKSAGSFTLNMAYNNFSFSNPGGLVPNEVSKKFTASALIQSGQFQSVSLIPAYYHTFVAWKRFFFTLGAGLGPMLQLIQLSSNIDNDEFLSGVSIRGNARSAFGYNGTSFYISVAGATDNFTYNMGQERRISTVISESRIILGYRLKATGLLKKGSDLMEKVPIRYN
jgi:hypothetical protein